MPELAACPSAQVRRHRHAVERRLRQRLFCHGAFRQALVSRLWLDVLGRGHGVPRSVFDGLAEVVVAAYAQPAPSGAPDLVFVAEVRDCASCPFGRRLAPPCLDHDHVVERAVEDGAGKGGARLRLDPALEAAEDGHVAELQVRSAVRLDEAQHDVRKSGLHGGQGNLSGVDAGHVPEKDPRLFFLARVQHVVVT